MFAKWKMLLPIVDTNLGFIKRISFGFTFPIYLDLYHLIDEWLTVNNLHAKS